MTLIYKSLCIELDNLLLEIIEGMEDYMNSKIQLEKTMNGGFVGIAKTRYINGTSSVTTLQLPTEFSKTLVPQATVNRTAQQAKGDSIHIENKLFSAKREANGVKNRHEKSSDEKFDEKKMEDPIRMFGVLVPQSLKLAQKSFVDALSEVGTTAELASALDYKLKRFSKLMQFKRQISNRIIKS